jgi:hypothetical protein
MGLSTMFKLYEVDPDADTLIIVPASSSSALPKSDDTKNGTRKQQPVNGSDAGNTEASSNELRLKVSSKHLSLASKHFADKFKWLEGDANIVQSDGRVHVKLDGFDPNAITIVMNIIHGRGPRIPKTLDLETLAKVAVFVDSFKCYDAVEAYADRWLGQLEKSTELPPMFFTCQAFSSRQPGRQY